MIFTVIGDPHVTHASLDKIDTLFNIAEDLGNPVIILGDLFDTKEIVRGKCLNLVHRRLKNSALQFYISVGNHDWFNLDCQDHSLKTLNDLPNVIIVDKPFNINMDSYACMMLPYYDDMNALKAVLKDAQEGGTDYVFMHQGMIGFDYGNGYIADGNGHGELGMESISGFKKVISGHFHKYAKSKNIEFLGTPFSHSFGESDQVKYIGLFDSETGEMELLETPFPRHRTVLIDCAVRNPMKLIEKTLNDKDIFRLTLVGTEMQIKAIDQSQFPGVKFIEEPNDVDQVETVLLEGNDSNEQKFLNWAKEIKGLDDATIAIGLSIMGEVS
jgi:DNA repair exonuclease SbcCD nuclease subunit